MLVLSVTIVFLMNLIYCFVSYLALSVQLINKNSEQISMRIIVVCYTLENVLCHFLQKCSFLSCFFEHLVMYVVLNP